MPESSIEFSTITSLRASDDISMPRDVAVLKLNKRLRKKPNPKIRVDGEQLNFAWNNLDAPQRIQNALLANMQLQRSGFVVGHDVFFALMLGFPPDQAKSVLLNYDEITVTPRQEIQTPNGFVAFTSGDIFNKRVVTSAYPLNVENPRFSSRITHITKLSPEGPILLGNIDAIKDVSETARVHNISLIQSLGRTLVRN